MPKTLLYVVNIPRFFVSHRLPLAIAARNAGYEVHVATSDADEASIAQIKAQGFAFHPLPLAQHGTNPLKEAQTVLALWRLYRDLRPSLLHHVSLKAVLYGGLAARLAGVARVVGAMSGLGYVFIGDAPKQRLLRALVVPMLRVALGGRGTRMIFQNPDDMARFVALGLIAPKKSVLIRGSGVDVSAFTPTPLPEGTPMVLFASRLMRQKGLDTFIEAASLLKGQARFVVVGYAEATSPDHVPPQELEALAQEGVIEWWGKRDDMPTVIAQASIVCLPSSYGEGVPKILIEAAACARPIVTTDVVGCREIVAHGENGLLVPPRNAPALAEAIRTLVDDPALRARMGANGRERVLAGFTLTHVTTATLALYQTLLKST
jgi:glycosyltransferase involved in cell wall biosynthesis